MPDIPYTLGLCRSCAFIKPITRVTLWGEPIGVGYYCRRRMHEVEGCDKCRDYLEVPTL